MATDPRSNVRDRPRCAAVASGALFLAFHLAACGVADRTSTPEASPGRGELTSAQGIGNERALSAADPRHAPRMEAGAPALGTGPAIARFGSGDARIVLAGRQMRLAAARVGRVGTGVLPLGTGAAATIAGPEVRTDRGTGIVEWWRSLPSGLEHGLTIAERPLGQGELSIDVEIGGALRPQPLSSDAIALVTAGGTRIATYAHLLVVDAAGASIPARMTVRDGRIAIAVDDAQARYPVVVDPTLATEEATLLGGDALDDDLFGAAVALSADGSRAVVGRPTDFDGDPADGSIGSAGVYVRTGTSWSLEMGLAAPDGSAGNQFGISVAMSADGSRAIVGAVFADLGGGHHSGAAYVFARNGSSWAEEAILVASDGQAEDLFGISVAMSADGSRAIVGAFGDSTAGGEGAGSARIFLRTGTTWAEEATLVASDGAAVDSFGISVALSADASRALVGNYLDDTAAGFDAGSARVFLRNGTSWAEEATLLASDGAAFDGFGNAVALSTDGTRAIVGASQDETPSGGFSAGSAAVFVRTGTSWTEDAQLVASDGAVGDGFGGTVAVSGDGSVAIIGVQGDNSGAGSARVFRRTATGWAEEATLAAFDAATFDGFGSAVALSSDGSRALVGVFRDDTSGGIDAGSARVFTLSASSPPCTTAADCGSGLFCVENLCCASACGGPMCPGTTAIPGCIEESASSCPGPCDVDLRDGAPDGVTLSFPGGISSNGEFSFKPCGAASFPPTGYKIVIGSTGQYCWDLETNASYSIPVTVCLHYPASIAAFEDSFQMVHDDGSGFLQNTTDRCLTNGFQDLAGTIACAPTLQARTICGFANSLSPFALIEPIDTTAPVFSPPPADVTAYATSTRGAVVHYPLPTAVDNLDGRTAVGCTAPSGTQFAPGKTTVTCTTADRHGNANTATFVVWVQYQAPGDGSFFLPPINAGGGKPSNAGSTIPVKFKLLGASAGINNLAAHLFVAKVSNGIAGAYVAAESTPACDGNTFRSGGAGQYIFNLSTKNLTAGTWSLRADLGDLVDHTVNLSLR